MPLALALPPVLWLFYIALNRKGAVELNVNILGFLAYSIFIHLISYLVTGLPIFLFQFRKLPSLVWELPVSLIVGILMGITPFVLFFASMGFGKVLSVDARIYLIGAGYGGITAFAAYCQRPLHNP